MKTGRSSGAGKLLPGSKSVKQKSSARPRGRGRPAKQTKINLTFPDGTFWKTVKFEPEIAADLPRVADACGLDVSDYCLALLGRAWRVVYGGGAK